MGVSRVCAKRPRGMAKQRKERAILWDRQGGRCYWCGQPMEQHPNRRDGMGATRDHIFTKPERIAMRAAGEPEDLVCAKVLAHKKCNHERGAMPFAKWEKLKRKTEIKEADNGR